MDTQHIDQITNLITDTTTLKSLRLEIESMAPNDIQRIISALTFNESITDFSLRVCYPKELQIAPMPTQWCLEILNTNFCVQQLDFGIDLPQLTDKLLQRNLVCHYESRFKKTKPLEHSV